MKITRMFAKGTVNLYDDLPLKSDSYATAICQILVLLTDSQHRILLSGGTHNW